MIMQQKRHLYNFAAEPPKAACYTRCVKTILITGASSGFGEAAAKRFVKEKWQLVLCARSSEKLAALKKKLKGAKVHVYPVDVRDRAAIEAMRADLARKKFSVDVLVNNAGLALGMSDIAEGDAADWDTMIDTNVKGLLYMTRAFLPDMIARNKGQIVNVGSIAGTQAYAKGAVYCATKAAVRFITDALRQELVATNIRVTNIQPGMAETNFSVVRFKGDEKKAKGVYQGIESLSADDIADAIAYAVLSPGHVQISELTIMPTHQAGPGVVHRR